MTVLVTGSTGTVGSVVAEHLASHGVEVRALTRSPEKADFPDGVTAVEGEMMDPDAMRAALSGVSGMFLLSAVRPEELTATLFALRLARDAGVKNFAYLSALGPNRFTDVPHVAAKGTAERMIEDFDLAATILRPGYYMQNDAGLKESILDHGVYDPPLGNLAVQAVDARDLAEVAALGLLRREEADGDLPRETLDVVDPEVLTGDVIAGIWAEVTGRPVSYGGDDLDAFEQRTRQFVPAYFAYDLRLMMERFQSDGLVAAPGDDDRVQEILGRPTRSYRDFARDTAASWND